VINPGNPTGSLLSRKNIEDIIDFAYRKQLVIIADEVYQNNIHKKGAQFISFKKVLNESAPEVKNSIELFSFISVSKGIQGECGLRGGAMECVNIDQKVKDQILKVQSIMLASNTLGQLAMELYVNPPQESELEPETWKLYQKETNHIRESLAERARLVTEYLNKMTNVKSNEVQGSMFAFPSLFFSEKALKAAKDAGKNPDVFYCFKLLEETGIVCVPGTGFHQVPGTHHLRIAVLANPISRMENIMKKFYEFNEKFHREYQIIGKL
jgi:aspartate/methionine/tyrosine aminotransferase